MRILTVCGAGLGCSLLLRMYVQDVFDKLGMSVEEILADWGYLAPPQVWSALAYYHDNREEVDRARYENSYEYWLERQPDAVA